MTSTPASAPRPPTDSSSPPVDDFASLVLDVVDSIPPGRVMAYGDIAEYLAAGPGPRQVGRVLAVYGGAVPWWRVTHSDGTPPPVTTAAPSSTTWPKVPRSAPPAPPSASTCPAPAGPATPNSKKIVKIPAYLEFPGNYVSVRK